VVSAKEWLVQLRSPLLESLTLHLVQRVPSETQAKVTFIDGQCVLVDLAAAMDMADCWLLTPDRVLKHRKSCYDLMVTTMLRGLLSSCSTGWGKIKWNISFSFVIS